MKVRRTVRQRPRFREGSWLGMLCADACEAGGVERYAYTVTVRKNFPNIFRAALFFEDTAGMQCTLEVVREAVCDRVHHDPKINSPKSCIGGGITFFIR